MSRSIRVLLLSSASIAVAALAAACGTERISVPKSRPVLYQGAVLFSQRCSGCHTLSYAATHGSASNPRTATAISGPNFNVRCERPITRVLYAIQNGGFSGAYMPQNIVVGAAARAVAQFVATYSGRAAPRQPGILKCQYRPIGTLPPPVTNPNAVAGVSPSTTTSSSSTTTAASAAAPAAKKHKKKSARS